MSRNHFRELIGAVFAEIWLPIRGYQGIYEVSNQGRVRSIKNPIAGHTGTILIPNESNGYLKVDLYRPKKMRNGKKKRWTAKIHWLVAQAFLKARRIKNPIVNHRNSDKHDNWDGNLETIKQVQNVQHYHRSRKDEPPDEKIDIDLPL